MGGAWVDTQRLHLKEDIVSRRAGRGAQEMCCLSQELFCLNHERQGSCRKRFLLGWLWAWSMNLMQRSLEKLHSAVALEGSTKHVG